MQKQHLISFNINSGLKKKTFSKLGKEGNFLNPIKDIYTKPIANIIWWKTECFLSKMGRKTRRSSLTTFFIILLEDLASTVWKEKKRHNIRKRNKLSLHTDNIISYTENLNKVTKLEEIIEFSTAAKYKINNKK